MNEYSVLFHDFNSPRLKAMYCDREKNTFLEGPVPTVGSTVYLSDGLLTLECKIVGEKPNHNGLCKIFEIERVGDYLYAEDYDPDFYEKCTARECDRSLLPDFFYKYEGV